MSIKMSDVDAKNDDSTNESVGAFKSTYQCLQFTCPMWCRLMITISMYAFTLIFFSYMIFNPELNHDRVSKQVRISNQAVGIYYLILFLVGFTPPMIILTITGKWSAAPFWYPNRKRWVIRLHTMFAFTWLLWSAVQVYLITLKNSNYHKVSGMCLVIFDFMPFIYTAVFSAYEKLSPLGPHVELMEIELGFGLLTFLMMGLITITTENYEGHMIAMVGLCFGAGGPGLFRVFRTLRETFSCRIWHYKHYTYYSDIHLDVENLKNTWDVEATYFTLSFCSEGVLVYFIYWLCDWYTHPLAIIIAIMPIGMCGINLILQKTCLKRINVSFSLDYNFKTLSFMPKHPNFEKNFHEQSNPAARAPALEMEKQL